MVQPCERTMIIEYLYFIQDKIRRLKSLHLLGKLQPYSKLIPCDKSRQQIQKKEVESVDWENVILAHLYAIAYSACILANLYLLWSGYSLFALCLELKAFSCVEGKVVFQTIPLYGCAVSGFPRTQKVHVFLPSPAEILCSLAGRILCSWVS